MSGLIFGAIAITTRSGHAVGSASFLYSGASDLVLASRLAHLRGLPLTIWLVVAYSLLLLLLLLTVLIGRKLARSVRAASALISGAGLALALPLLWIEVIVLRGASRVCVAGILAVAGVFAAILVRGLPVSTRARQAAITGAVLIIGACAFAYLLPRGGLPDIKALRASAPVAGLVRLESHVSGSPQAPLVVEFADFECAACALQAHSMQTFLEHHPNDLRFAFRHFPLTWRHPHALQAAEAVECAANDNKFWEMSRLIYLRHELDSGSLKQYATYLNVDQKPFDACLSTGKMRYRVETDISDARALGIHATPTFVVGRLIIEGTIDPAKLAEITRHEHLKQNGNNSMPSQDQNVMPGKVASDAPGIGAPCDTGAVCK
jgi:protein-disulfide isomerase